MKVTTIRDLRRRISRLVEGDDPILVTRHGTPTAILMPLRLLESELDDRLRRALIEIVGAEIRRQMAEKGVAEEDVLRDFAEFRSSGEGRG